jgi:heme/copper-type cytochrome/quinol oxidase subunit 2
VIPLSETAAHVLFWGAATVAVFAQAMVLRAALAGRTPAASDTTGARAREVLWIVLPAITLAVVLWFTWQALPRAANDELTPAGLRSIAGAPTAVAGGA